MGTFDAFVEEKHQTLIEQDYYLWTVRKVPRLSLSHTATLFLLQGMQLKHLLLSNHYVRRRGVEEELDMGEMVVRVDPWDYRKPVPVLTNLVLAYFHGEPVDVVQRLLPAVIRATS